MQLFQQLSVDTFVILCTERVLVIKRCVRQNLCGNRHYSTVLCPKQLCQEAGLIVPYLMNLTQRLQLYNDAKHSEVYTTVKYIKLIITRASGQL